MLQFSQFHVAARLEFKVPQLFMLPSFHQDFQISSAQHHEIANPVRRKIACRSPRAPRHPRTPRYSPIASLDIELATVRCDIQSLVVCLANVLTRVRTASARYQYVLDALASEAVFGNNGIDLLERFTCDTCEICSTRDRLNHFVGDECPLVDSCVQYRRRLVQLGKVSVRTTRIFYVDDL